MVDDENKLSYNQEVEQINPDICKQLLP